MRLRRDIARLVALAGCVGGAVFAASCDRASQPVAPDGSKAPLSFDAASGDSVYVDVSIVPDSIKQAALLSGPSASPQRSSLARSASQPSLSSATSGGYDVFAVPFTPEPAPTANAGPTCDDCVMHGVPIGFSFTYWGNTYTNVEIGSNGFVGFGKSGADFVSNGCCEGGVIPSTVNETGTPNIIALAWTDWNPTLGGTIRYETQGTAPNRKFVLQYTGIREYQTVGTLTAQLVLDEGSGDITMYTMSQGSTRHLVTQGIQNRDGTDAVFWPGRVHTQYTLANDAIRFSTQPLAMTTPPDLSVPTDAGVCSATINPGTASANHDAVVTAVRSDALALGDAYPKGSTTITWTATDAAPTPVSVSAVQSITVSDGERPAISATPNLTAAASSAAGASLSVAAPGATDNCPGVSVAGTRSDGAALTAVYPAGSTTITWIATDASGNTATAAQVVTVTPFDNVPPVLSLPASMTVNATMPSGAVVTYSASATDNVGVTSFGCVPTSGSTFAIGTTAVACRDGDAAGNSVSGSFNVKVLGAAEQLANLIEYVRGVTLTDTQKAQLISLLQNALSSSPSTACSLLTRAISIVKAVPTTTLSSDRSARIIADLTRIKSVIGCS